MVQVDVFWAYGIGAGFALAASHQLVPRPERANANTTVPPGPGGMLANPYLTGAILFCAAIFTPSGVWLLWGFPNWETMQVGSHTMPAWLVAAFAMTNTTQGVVGFLVTQWLLRRRMIRWAALQVVTGYFLMFFILVHGWDGNGFKRFLSLDKPDYRAWADRSALDNLRQWIGSDVALTLYGMGAVMIPLMLVIMYCYYREGVRAARVQSPVIPVLLVLVLGSVFGGALGAAIGASLLIHLFTTFTGTAAGWALGVVTTAVLLWFLVARPGALASYVIRWLALPADRPSTTGPSGRGRLDHGERVGRG